MFVIICGITRREDAWAVVECGASAIGFVFWPDSPRFVDPAVARAISEALPSSVQAVGVFVNQDVDEIKKYLAEIGRRGGLKGGKARMDSMTPKQRTALAKKAAEARWGTNKATKKRAK